MKKINDIKQLNKLLMPFFKRGILTNNYMMMDKYKEYIEDGTLFFEKSDNEMIILRDCDNHWRVYYYLTDFKSQFKLPDDKPLAMEIVFESKDDKYKEIVSYWEDIGFKPYMFRSRMTSDVTDINIDNSENLLSSYAKPKHALEIHKLISSTFDEYLGCVPTLSEVKDLIDKEEIICIENNEEKIDGLLHIGKSRNIHSIWHIVVASEARKSGNAQKMLAFFKDILLQDEKSKLQLWVQDDNLPARRLYEGMGLEYDGWESIGLIK